MFSEQANELVLLQLDNHEDISSGAPVPSLASGHFALNAGLQWQSGCFCVEVCFVYVDHWRNNITAFQKKIGIKALLTDVYALDRVSHFPN
jgi:hypothetical protein